MKADSSIFNSFKKRIFIFACLNVIFSLVIAQKTQALLTTTAGIVHVGEPIAIQLEVIHAEDEAVIFPDSATGFPGFELRKRKPQATETTDGISRDKGAYDLYTWEVDANQSLKLTVALVKGKDTTLVESNEIHFTIDPVIKKFSDSLQVRAFTGVVDVPEPFNRRAFIILFSLALIAIIGTFLLMRSPFIRWMRARRVSREWKKSQERLEALRGLLSNQNAFIQQVNHVWKQYFDPHRAFSLTSLTTAELQPVLQQFPNLNEPDQQVLNSASRSAEMILFAGRGYAENEMNQLLTQVTAVMEREYQRRLEEARK